MILAKGDEYISNFIASAIKATQSLPGMSDFGADVLKEQENIVKVLATTTTSWHPSLTLLTLV